MKLTRHKKAVAGIDFLEQFVIGLFILIVIIFAFVIAGSNMQVTSREKLAGTVLNESGYVNSSGYNVNSTLRAYQGFFLGTVTQIRNASNSLVIGSANYTYYSNGSIHNASSAAWENVRIDYTYGYTRDTVATGVIGNFTAGILTLGGNVPTWVTIAGLVVLMSIMAVIIIVVKRLRDNGGSEL